MSKNQKAKKPTTAIKKPQQDNNTFSQQAQQDLNNAEKLLRQVNKESLTSAKERDKYEKKLEEAFISLSSACNKDATMSRAFYMRGKCYYHMGDFQRALFDFSVAIRIEEDKKVKENTNKKETQKDLADYYNFAGVQHYELGQLDEALQHYKLAVEYDEKNGMYHYNLGLVNSRLDNVDISIRSYTKALEHLDQSSQMDYVYQAKFNLGICYRRKRMLSESIECLKAATGMKPDKASAHNNLALSYFENEFFDEALTHYTKAIGIDPSSVHHNNRGLANYHCDKLDDAKLDFDFAIEKDPSDATIYFNRGNVFLNQPDQNYDAAHKDYDTALELAPSNPKLWHSKGLAFQGQSEYIFQKTGSYDQMCNQLAIDMYIQALKLQPNFVSSQFHLGLMQHRTNSFQEALKCFSKVIEKIDNDKTVYVARGTVYQDMGNHQLAIRDFDRAISIDEDLSEGYFRRGFSKYFIKDFRGAIENFETSREKEDKIIEDDPKFERNPGIFDGLGCCYHSLEKYDDAFENFDKAIEGAPENTDFLMHRANCHYSQQQGQEIPNYKSSINDLQQALEYGQKNPQVLYKLGLSYYAHKDYKRCVNTLKQALMNKPFPSYEPDIYYHIGLSYCMVEKFEKSIYPYSQAIQMIPSEIKYIHERAKAYQMIGDHENSNRDFSTVVKKNPKNAHAHFRRAFSLKALKQYDRSVEDFEQSKKLDPTNPMMVVNYKQLKGVSCIVLCKPGEEKIF